MSNLSDLLPAGAAAKQLTFTDSGSGIATKKPVILNSDGTVTEVGTTTLPIAVGSAIDFSGGTATGLGYYASVCYDTANDKIFIAYRDQDNSSYGTGVVCTASGTTLSVGTPVVFSSNLTSHISCCFDSSNNKVFVAYQNSSAQGEAVVATISGTSVSYGSSGRIDGGGSNKGSYIEAVFDANAGKVFTAYYDSYNGSAYGTVHTISGTSFSSGSPAMFVGYVYPLGQTYDSTAQKIITTIQTGVSTLFSVSVTISGTSWSNGTYLSIGPCNGNADVSYDPVQDKTLQYFNDSTANTGKVAVLSLSGTTLSSGSQVDNTGSSEGYIKSVYNAASASHVIIWSQSSTGKARDVTISGTTPTLNATTTNWSPDYLDYIGAAYDEDQKVTVIATANSVAPKCYAIAYQSSYDSTNLTATNFVGVADSAISSSAAGSVIVQGGTVSGITDPFGTITPTYGTPTDVISPYQSESKVLAYDSANNRFVMAYKDGSNSDYGTAVVGELSGTSITWGTPVVFNSATTGSEGLALAFDSNVNRMVIAYQDQGNSSYGTAIVGSVSGTGSGSTIAFGAESVFLSSSTAYIGMEFDSNDNRIVIIYADVANATYTYRVEYVIGTVTTGPDAISFNTPAPINGNSGTYEPVGVCFDASENKILAAYTDNSYDLYVVNLAVSSGSGTPGTASSYSVGQERYPRAVYDSVNSKCGVSWATNTGVYPISFSVISMSGSSVTINTPVQAGATSDSNPFMHNMAFDSSVGQIAICTRSGSSSKGIAYYGSISGTTSSWATESLFADETINAYGVDVAYDTSANKLAFVYTDNTSGTDSLVATLAATTFTTGTKYYVTTSGGFSSSADTPSVNAGLAISTTSLLLNGDS